MGVESDHRPRSEAASNNEVGYRTHPMGAYKLRGNIVTLNDKPEALQQSRGSVGVGRGVTGRIVRRDLDEFGQKLALGLKILTHQSPDLPDVGLRFTCGLDRLG
jgi:hypothetical protein